MGFINGVSFLPLIGSWVVLVIVAFSVGYSIGNRRAKKIGMDEELRATETMLTKQGDTPDVVKVMMEVLRAKKLNEFKAEGREYLAIWLPSLLVVIGIIVTVVLGIGKSKP